MTADSVDAKIARARARLGARGRLDVARSWDRIQRGRPNEEEREAFRTFLERTADRLPDGTAACDDESRSAANGQPNANVSGPTARVPGSIERAARVSPLDLWRLTAEVNAEARALLPEYREYRHVRLEALRAARESGAVIARTDRERAGDDDVGASRSLVAALVVAPGAPSPR